MYHQAEYKRWEKYVMKENEHMLLQLDAGKLTLRRKVRHGAASTTAGTQICRMQITKDTLHEHGRRNKQAALQETRNRSTEWMTFIGEGHDGGELDKETFEKNREEDQLKDS